MAADATVEGVREVLEESLDEIRRGVADLSVAELNARPAGGETNSVAVIVTHVQVNGLRASGLAFERILHGLFDRDRKIWMLGVAFAAALPAPCGTTKLALAELRLGEGIQQREREILG